MHLADSMFLFFYHVMRRLGDGRSQRLRYDIYERVLIWAFT